MEIKLYLRKSKMKIFRIFFPVLLIFYAQCVNAQTIGSPSSYTGLKWAASFNATGVPNSCNEIVVDGIADFVRGSGITLVGYLNCPALNTSYVVTGGGYLTVTGRLNLALTFGNGYVITCPEMSQLSGNCAVTSNAGYQVGTTYLQFK